MHKIERKPEWELRIYTPSRIDVQKYVGSFYAMSSDTSTSSLIYSLHLVFHPPRFFLRSLKSKVGYTDECFCKNRTQRPANVFSLRTKISQLSVYAEWHSRNVEI